MSRKTVKGGVRGSMANVLDCDIVVSESELQLRYYVHFRTKTLRKGMNTPYPYSYNLDSTTTVLLQ